MTTKHIASDLAGLSYGLQPSFTGATTTYTALRAESIKFTPSINQLSPAYQKPEACRGPDADIEGAYGGTLSFSIPLRAGAGSGAPAVALGRYCGTTLHSITAATAHITGGTSVTFTISTANAAAHGLATTSVGALVFHSPTTGTRSVRPISRVSVSSNVMTVTVAQSFATSPTTGDSLLGFDTLVPTNGSPSKYLSFRDYLGEGATDKLLWTVSGCAGTFKLETTEAGGIPMLSFEYQADRWVDSDTSASTAVKAADSYSPAKPVLADALYLETTQTDVKSIAFDPGMKLVPLTSTYGTHGRTGWYYIGTEPSLTIDPYHDDDLITAWEAATQKAVLFESLNGSTGWALYLPETQITAYDLQDDAGLMRSAMTLKAIDPGKNADNVNYPLWALGVSR